MGTATARWQPALRRGARTVPVVRWLKSVAGTQSVASVFPYDFYVELY